MSNSDFLKMHNYPISEDNKSHYLLFYFLTEYTTIRDWDEDIFPYLDKLKIGEVPIDDWVFGYWGRMCFRKDYIMLIEKEYEFIIDKTLDEKKEIIAQKGKRLWFGLRDKDDEPLCNEEGRWLVDTVMIEKYNPSDKYLKIPMDEFYQLCKDWRAYIYMRQQEHQAILDEAEQSPTKKTKGNEWVALSKDGTPVKGWLNPDGSLRASTVVPRSFYDDF